MKKRNLAIIIIFILFFLLIALIILNSYREVSNLSEKDSENDSENELYNSDTDEDELGTEKPTPGVSGNSVLNQGGGDSQETDCISKQISHAIKRFEEEAICNQYEQDNCIDKTITCSLVVENFDYGVSDSFKINFIILDENNNQLDSQNVEKLVSSRQEELFLKDFNVQTQEAEEEISCSYSVTKIPVKQNC